MRHALTKNAQVMQRMININQYKYTSWKLYNLKSRETTVNQDNPVLLDVFNNIKHTMKAEDVCNTHAAHLMQV